MRDRVRIRVNGEQEQDAAKARSNKSSQVEYVRNVVCIMRLKYPDCEITHITVGETSGYWL